MFTSEQIAEMQTMAMRMLRKKDFTYSALIWKIREKSGLGRKEFARRVSVDESTIKRIELNEKYNPTKSSLEKILSSIQMELGLVAVRDSRVVAKIDGSGGSAVSKAKPKGRLVNGVFIPN